MSTTLPTRRRSSRSSDARRARPGVEQLESRLVPYSASGNAWPAPQLITISFVPDNTIVGSNGSGYIYSNLFSAMNAKFATTATWQNEILRGAQLWAQQTNINFAVISDSGVQSGNGNYQQGDSTIGDIRIGGYNIGGTTLGLAVLPPPVNNYSIAGDINFNTNSAWHIGTTYDLQTVAAHEVGHALGLYHTTVTNAATMWASYTTFKRTLNADDISGIRNIYSSNNARSADAYDVAASNETFGTATNINSSISSLTGLVTGLDITTTSDLDYYTFTAPTGTNSSFTVNVQSTGLSMLTPTLTVYNGSQTQLATVSGVGVYGTTLSLTITGVTAGATYYVKVAGADTSAFSTGAYAMTLNFGNGATPTVPLPNTQTANGNPLTGGGGIAEKADDVHKDAFPDQDATTPATSATANATPAPQAATTTLHGAPVQAATTDAQVVAVLTKDAVSRATTATAFVAASTVTTSVMTQSGQPQSAVETATTSLTSTTNVTVVSPLFACTTTVTEQTVGTDAPALSSTDASPALSIPPQASDSCFAETSWLEESPALAGDDASWLAADMDVIVEPVAAFAGVAMLLAGLRYKPEEERKTREQRLEVKR